ncbi:MAG: hypothetical protein ACKVU1_12165 [bacterium]
MKIIGGVLAILGIVALIFGGINYTKEKTVLEVGSLNVTATEHKSFPVPPLVGALALIAGVALVVVDRRRA